MNTGSLIEFLSPGRCERLICPACHSASMAPVFARVAALQAPGGFADWASCQECASVFAIGLEPPPYHDEGGVAPAAIKYHIEQGAALDLGANMLACVDDRPLPITCIDIGCAFGFLLDYAKHALGWQVRGVDPSPFARAGAEALDLDIANTYLSLDNSAALAADVVLCSEVIEHIVDPNPFVTTLKSAMKPGGIILMTTPNARATAPDAPPAYHVMAFAPGQHLIVFSSEGLRRTLQRAGFAHISVIEQTGGLHLFAAAWDEGRGADFTRGADLGRFQNWLLRRSLSFTDPALRGGFLTRLLKSQVNAGEWKKAAEVGPMVMNALIEAGVDPRCPADITPPDAADFPRFAASFPLYAPSALYYLARVEERAGAHEHAEALARAAARCGGAMHASLTTVPAKDLEAEELAFLGQIMAARLLARRDPQAAAYEFSSLREAGAPEAVLARATLSAMDEVDDARAPNSASLEALADSVMHNADPADGALALARAYYAMNHKRDARTALTLLQQTPDFLPDDRKTAVDLKLTLTRRLFCDACFSGDFATADALVDDATLVADPANGALALARAYYEMNHKADARAALTILKQAPDFAPADRENAADLKLILTRRVFCDACFSGDLAAAAALADEVIAHADEPDRFPGSQSAAFMAIGLYKHAREEHFQEALAWYARAERIGLLASLAKTMVSLKAAATQAINDKTASL